MDEIELSIRAAWDRVRPHLVDDPSEYCRRLSRRPAIDRPPRAWCLAVRASDTRLDRYCCNIPDIKSANQVQLDKRALGELFCVPVTLDSPGEPIADVAAKLGVSRGSLLHSRVKGVFQTHHIPSYCGRPQPLLYTDQPLDPSSRSFATPDPIWSWTATYLPTRLPDDHPPQTLTRIAHFRVRGAHLHRDTSQLHPEHPLVDQTLSLSKGRSLKLPPPQPDHVWYKWKGNQYLGYDWRNPHAAANYHRREQQKAKSRAAQKARRLANPKPSKASGSLQFRGWKWLCPKCNRAVNVLYLPVRPINLLKDEIRRACPVFDPEAQTRWELVEGLKDEGNSNQKSKIEIQKSPSFACKSCHRVSGCKKSAWGEIVFYLSGGLLYGNEVPRPRCFAPVRKIKYSPRPSRDPSMRRPQIEKLLLSGADINEIAKILNLSKGTILFYCKQIYPQHGVKCLRDLLLKYGIDVPRNMRGPARGKRGDGRVPRPKHPRLTARQQIRERILKGESPQQIATVLDLSMHQVLDHLSKLRVATRIPADMRLRRRGITPALRNAIRRRITDGQSTVRIAKELGVTLRAIYNQRWVMKKVMSFR